MMPMPMPAFHHTTPPSQEFTRHAHQATHPPAPAPTAAHVHLQRHLARLGDGALLAGPLLQVALAGLLIEELTRLRHGHADELVLPPAPALPLATGPHARTATTAPAHHTSSSSSTATAAREHLQRLHRRPRPDRLAAMPRPALLLPAPAAVHGLMRTDRRALVDALSAVRLVIALQMAHGVLEQGRVAGAAGVQLRVRRGAAELALVAAAVRGLGARVSLAVAAGAGEAAGGLVAVASAAVPLLLTSSSHASLPTIPIPPTHPASLPTIPISPAHPASLPTISVSTTHPTTAPVPLPFLPTMLRVMPPAAFFTHASSSSTVAAASSSALLLPAVVVTPAAASVAATTALVAVLVAATAAAFVFVVVVVVVGHCGRWSRGRRVCGCTCGGF